MKRILSLIVAFLFCANLYAETFPFVVSYDAPTDGVSMAFLLDAPAGKHGFVRVDGDQFVTDTGEIRFWATNLSGNGNFPDKEHADKLVDRLARFGFNCVRLHWMDGYALWGEKPTSLRKIDPAMLDKLDYLIAALKKQGIYVNINLHVARWLDDRDGFPHKDKRPKYDKGIDNFEPRMIELQKEFARDLMTHVNPYTEVAYTDEPAVAMVEINNENSVLSEWANGNLDDLPEPYGPEFQKQWNDWLRKKYGSTEKMLEAWNCRNYPLGEEMLLGGDFSKPLEFNKGTWTIQLDDAEHADCKVVPEEKRLQISVHRDGKVSWTPQLYYRNLKIEKDKPYTLSFRVRADKTVWLNTGVSMDTAPWRNLGTHARIQVTPEWKTFTYRFFGTEDFDNARFNFTGMKTGKFEFADFTLRSGGEFGIAEGARLENGTVPLMKNSEQYLSEEFRRDFWRFLVDIEWRYWLEMQRYLKEDLKVKQPISGTQLYYGSKHVQAALDYCDDHAYWNHPSWPSKPWDREDWLIRNRALVNWADRDIFTKLGPRRIAGKPHTISEYNHPFPNQFAAEGLPMICAFSQFQRWNGIYQYTYVHQPNIEPRKFTGYFDMIAQQGQLVHAPACAAMILRGDVTGAQKTIYGTMNQDAEIEALLKLRWPSLVGAKDFGIDQRLSLLHATALNLTGNNSRNEGYSRSDGVNSLPPSLRRSTDSIPAIANTHDIPEITEDQKVFFSDTGELIWNMEEENAGYFTLTTSKTKVFTGFIKNREFQLGSVKLSFGKTRLDWATVSLTELEPNRLLLAATGFMENSGMKFEKYADDDTDRMTLRQNWGDEPILCEGVPLSLTLPTNGKKATCFALDESGRRKTNVVVEKTGEKVRIQTSSDSKTLWYEIVFE